MKAPTQTVNLKATEPTLGVMDQFTRESSKMDFDSVSEFGSSEHRNMKEPTSTTKEMEKAFILGREEAITRALLLKI